MSADSEHSSPIKTPRQLITVILLAFAVPVFIIVLLVKYVAAAKIESAGANVMAPESIEARLRAVAMVEFAGAAGAKILQAGEAVYQSSCAACHGTGAAGAPKFSDTAAWGPRLKQGYETLVQHAVEGYKTMPARGGNVSLDPIEVARAVAYMGNAAGAKFKEPEAPSASAAATTTPAAAASAAPNAATPTPAANTAAPAAIKPAALATAATVAVVATSTAAATSAAGNPAGETLVKTVCSACHLAGVAGAPKIGDKEAWAPRIKTGIDALVGSVTKGKGAMPPRGASAATDAELRAAVEYLVAQAK